MKHAGDAMKILEAYGFVGSCRAAAEIADCDHQTGPTARRTSRGRAVSLAKKAYAAGRRRVYRPWIPEPGG